MNTPFTPTQRTVDRQLIDLSNMPLTRRTLEFPCHD